MAISSCFEPERSGAAPTRSAWGRTCAAIRPRPSFTAPGSSQSSRPWAHAATGPPSWRAASPRSGCSWRRSRSALAPAASPSWTTTSRRSSAPVPHRCSPSRSASPPIGHAPASARPQGDQRLRWPVVARADQDQGGLSRSFTAGQGGFVAVSLDPWRHGQRGTESGEQIARRVFGNFRRHMWPILGQTTLDSRVVDWAMADLHAGPEVVAGGVSMGGDVAVALVGIDNRITRVAAIVATPDWTRPGMTDLFDPYRVLPQGQADAYPQWFHDQLDPLTHLHAYAHGPAITFECGADLPAEQIAVEPRERVKVATGDLEPHHWSRHVRASGVRCVDERSVVPGGDTVLSGIRTDSGFEPTVLVARMPRRRVPGPGLHALTATPLPPQSIRRANRPMRGWRGGQACGVIQGRRE